MLNRCIALKKLGIRFLLVYDAYDQLYEQMKALDLPIVIVNHRLKTVYYLFPFLNFLLWCQITFYMLKLGAKKIHVHHPYLLKNIPPFIPRKSISCHNHMWFAPGEFTLKAKTSGIRGWLKTVVRRRQYDIRRASKLISVSKSSERFAKENFRFKTRTEFLVLLNAVRFNSMKSDCEVEHTNKPCVDVVLIGNISRDKGFFDVVELVTRTPDLNYRWYGKIDYSTVEKTILERLPDNLRLMDYVDDIFPYLREAEVFLSLSHREAMPNVVLEAATTGLKIITWDIDPMVEMKDLGFDMVTVKQGSFNLLVKQVRKVHKSTFDPTNNKELCQNLSQNHQVKKFCEMIGIL